MFSNIRRLAKEIHQNAVDHGWWDGERKTEEILALIHSEWSEALEEYRDHRPMVYGNCGAPDYAIRSGCKAYMDTKRMCDASVNHACAYRLEKPEGIAVELIDGCIRILDFIVRKDEAFLDAVDFEEILFVLPLENVKDRMLPEIIAALHWYVSEAYIQVLPVMTDMRVVFEYLLEAMGVAFSWISAEGHDPLEIMKLKHAYNKTRPYKHGGKKC